MSRSEGSRSETPQPPRGYNSRYGINNIVTVPRAPSKPKASEQQKKCEEKPINEVVHKNVADVEDLNKTKKVNSWASNYLQSIGHNNLKPIKINLSLSKKKTPTETTTTTGNKGKINPDHINYPFSVNKKLDVHVQGTPCVCEKIKTPIPNSCMVDTIYSNGNNAIAPAYATLLATRPGESTYYYHKEKHSIDIFDAIKSKINSEFEIERNTRMMDQPNHKEMCENFIKEITKIPRKRNADYSKSSLLHATKREKSEHSLSTSPATENFMKEINKAPKKIKTDYSKSSSATKREKSEHSESPSPAIENFIKEISNAPKKRKVDYSKSSNTTKREKSEHSETPSPAIENFVKEISNAPKKRKVDYSKSSSATKREKSEHSESPSPAIENFIKEISNAPKKKKVDYSKSSTDTKREKIEHYESPSPAKKKTKTTKPIKEIEKTVKKDKNPKIKNSEADKVKDTITSKPVKELEKPVKKYKIYKTKNSEADRIKESNTTKPVKEIEKPAKKDKNHKTKNSEEDRIKKSKSRFNTATPDSKKGPESTPTIDNKDSLKIKQMKNTNIKRANPTKNNSKCDPKVHEELPEIKSHSSIQSVVQVAENHQSKSPNKQCLDENFDLRSKLSRVNERIKRRNYYPDRLKDANPIINTPMDNLKITVHNKIPEKKSPKNLGVFKPKSKKCKKLKLIINVVCKEADDDSSSNDSSFSETENTQAQNMDLSFLDDFNVDEIVDSLKHSPLKKTADENSASKEIEPELKLSKILSILNAKSEAFKNKNLETEFKADAIVTNSVGSVLQEEIEGIAAENKKKQQPQMLNQNTHALEKLLAQCKLQLNQQITVPHEDQSYDSSRTKELTNINIINIDDISDDNKTMVTDECLGKYSKKEKGSADKIQCEENFAGNDILVINDDNKNDIKEHKNHSGISNQKKSKEESQKVCNRLILNPTDTEPNKSTKTREEKGENNVSIIDLTKNETFVSNTPKIYIMDLTDSTDDEKKSNITPTSKIPLTKTTPTNSNETLIITTPTSKETLIKSTPTSKEQLIKATPTIIETLYKSTPTSMEPLIKATPTSKETLIKSTPYSKEQLIKTTANAIEPLIMDLTDSTDDEIKSNITPTSKIPLPKTTPTNSNETLIITTPTSKETLIKSIPTSKEQLIKTTPTSMEPLIKSIPTSKEQLIKTTPTSMEPLIKATKNSKETLIKATSTSNEPFIKTTLTSMEPLIKATPTSKETLIKETPTSNEPFIKATPTSNEPFLNTTLTPMEPLIKAATNSKETLIKATPATKETLVEAKLTPMEPLIKAATNSKETLIKATSTSKETLVKAKLTSNESLIKTTPTSIEPLIKATVKNKEPIITTLPTNSNLVEKIMEKNSHLNMKVLKCIHKGRFSKIFTCINPSGEIYTAKLLKYFNKNTQKQRDMLTTLQQDIPKQNLNTVFLLDGFAVKNEWCFIMEYYPKTLKEALDAHANKKLFHVHKVQDLARQLISAVMLFRNNQIIHSDINPSHILLNASNDRLKICGFDRAYYKNEAKALPNIATPNYRAPELILGFSAGYSIDVWASALVIYEMATNKLLFKGIYNNDILYQQMSTFGDLPWDMVQASPFQFQHFRGRIFMRRLGAKSEDTVPVHKFYKTKRLFETIMSAKNEHWVTKHNFHWKHEDYKLNALAKLLEEMLELDPRKRLAIEFVLLHPFIFDVL